MQPAEPPSLELYQAEWCPYSHRVRTRLTELGVDVILRQVAADRASEADEQGDGRRHRCDANGRSPHRRDHAWLDARHAERADIDRHRAKRRADWPLWVDLHAREGRLPDERRRGRR